MAESSVTTEDTKYKPQDASPPAPLGVKALCILFGLIGILLALFGVLAVIGGSSLGVVFAALGGLELAMVYGLWTVTRWGWTLAMVLFSISALANLLNVMGILNTAAGGRGGATFGFFLVAGVLLYLYQQRDLYQTAKASR